MRGTRSSVYTMMLLMGVVSFIPPTTKAEESDEVAPLSVVGVRLIKMPLRQAERWCEEHHGRFRVGRRPGSEYATHVCRRARPNLELLVGHRNQRIVFFRLDQEGLTEKQVLAAFRAINVEAGTQKSNRDLATSEKDLDRETIWWQDVSDDVGVETIGTFQYDSRYQVGKLSVSRAIVKD